MIQQTIAGIFCIENSEVKSVDGGFHNKICEIKDAAGREIIVRLTDKKRRTLAEIEEELAFIQLLKNNGLAVAGPVKTVLGEMVTETSEMGNTFFLAAFEKAEGHPVDVTRKDEWNPRLFYNWGKFLGKMHSISASMKPDFPNRKRWRTKSPDVLGLLEKIKNPETAVRYKELLNALCDFDPMDRDLFGLTHNDFHQGNFFIHKQELISFDFDDCSYNWFPYDIAVSFYHAYWQTSSFNPGYKNFAEEFFHSFLDGYSSMHPLKTETLLQLPAHLRIRDIFLITLFHEKWDLNGLEAWQEYTLRELEERIVSRSHIGNFDFSSL